MGCLLRIAAAALLASFFHQAPAVFAQGQPDCYTGNGADYRGFVNSTEDGRACANWLEYGYSATYDAHMGVGDHTYCRNPDNDTKPWCYVQPEDPAWTYCDVQYCVVESVPANPPSQPDCYTGNGTDYRGFVSSTEDGRTCANWLEYGYNPTYHAHMGVGDHNYCRNLFNETKPWCYSHSSGFEYCDVQQCVVESVPANPPKHYWADTVLGCIKRRNHWVGVVSSLEDCQQKCLEATDFTCLSIEYLERTKSCRLSRMNRRTLKVTDKFKQPCPKANWTYAERVDVGEWTPEVYACIRNDNIRPVSVPDLASCKLVCSQDDECCSVNYRKGQCNLSQKRRATVDPATDFTEPCYKGKKWQFAELVDKSCEDR